MGAAHRFYQSLLGGPSLVGHIFDWNPTENTGTVITDKNGSGIDLTTNGIWVASGLIRYDATALHNFRFSRVVHPVFSMAESSCLLYVKLPAAWTVGAYLAGHQPINTGHVNDRKLRVGIGAPAAVTITQNSGLSDKTATGTTNFGVTDEFVAGWTHDGATLKLWVNGVEEDSIACGPAGTGTPRAFQVGGGEVPFTDKEPPSTNGLFGSTGAVFGRCLAANHGLSDAEVAAFYAEYQTQYPGLP